MDLTTSFDKKEPSSIHNHYTGGLIQESGHKGNNNQFWILVDTHFPNFIHCNSTA